MTEADGHQIVHFIYLKFVCIISAHESHFEAATFSRAYYLVF